MVLNKNILFATATIVFFSLIISLTFLVSIVWAQSSVPVLPSLPPNLTDPSEPSAAPTGPSVTPGTPTGPSVTPGTPTGPNPSGGGTYSLLRPTQAESFGAIIKGFANLLSVIGIPLITIFVVWAGYLFVSARGNEQQLARAKSLFFWMIVGAAIIIGAQVLARVFVDFASRI